MANNLRKPLTFNVSTAMYDRMTALFPNASIAGKPDCSEATLQAILEAYENPAESNTDLLQRMHKIEEERDNLQKSNAELQKQLTETNEQSSNISNNIEETRAALESLQAEYSDQKVQNEQLQQQNADLQEQINQLQAVQTTDELASITDPFTRELLQTVTERLAQQTNTPDLKPMQVLLDGFLKYNIQQYNLWFYDFVMSKSEILKMANKYNTEIDSYKKLQKALGIYD